MVEMSFVGRWCWMPPSSLRRSLASGQKMKPPIFPTRRNLIPPSSAGIYWQHRLSLQGFLFRHEMHDIKDVNRKYDAMSD